MKFFSQIEHFKPNKLLEIHLISSVDSIVAVSTGEAISHSMENPRHNERSLTNWTLNVKQFEFKCAAVAAANVYEFNVSPACIAIAIAIIIRYTSINFV